MGAYAIHLLSVFTPSSPNRYRDSGFRPALSGRGGRRRGTLRQGWAVVMRSGQLSPHLGGPGGNPLRNPLPLPPPPKSTVLMGGMLLAAVGAWGDSKGLVRADRRTVGTEKWAGERRRRMERCPPMPCLMTSSFLWSPQRQDGRGELATLAFTWFEFEGLLENGFPAGTWSAQWNMPFTLLGLKMQVLPLVWEALGWGHGHHQPLGLEL